MPKKGNGQSLKEYRVSGTFGSLNGTTPGQNLEPFNVKASSLVGAVGRGAREGRKQLAKGRFTTVTIIVEAN